MGTHVGIEISDTVLARGCVETRQSLHGFTVQADDAGCAGSFLKDKGRRRAFLEHCAVSTYVLYSYEGVS